MRGQSRAESVEVMGMLSAGLQAAFIGSPRLRHPQPGVTGHRAFGVCTDTLTAGSGASERPVVSPPPAPALSVIAPKRTAVGA